MRPGTEAFLDELTKIPGIKKLWVHVCQPRYLPFAVPLNIEVTQEKKPRAYCVCSNVRSANFDKIIPVVEWDGGEDDSELKNLITYLYQLFALKNKVQKD